MTEKYTPENVAELVTGMQRQNDNPHQYGPGAVEDLRDRLADALTAVSAERDATHAGWDADVQRLAEAYNENRALKAELRQERERADEASHAAGRHKSDAALFEANLSRAEETIEKASAEARQRSAGRLDILRTLTEYQTK